jgi:hypothetical protein
MTCAGVGPSLVAVARREPPTALSSAAVGTLVCGCLGEKGPSGQERLKRRPWAAYVVAAGLLASPVHAADHNNLDAGRPLRFDDAEPLALREQALEVGFGAGWPRRGPLGAGLQAEYLYGFALNAHLSVGLDPSVGGRSESGDTGVSAGDLSFGLFHQLRREIRSAPAMAVRWDAALPTGRGSRGVDLRLRGILTRTLSSPRAPGSRLHLNFDLGLATHPGRGERQLNPGLVIGYSRPLGYPRRFTRTGLAELAVQAGPESGTGPVVSLGLGLRQQVGVRSVMDLGIRSDVAGINGAPRDRLRLVAGYSYGF